MEKTRKIRCYSYGIKPYSINIFIKKDDATMKRRKRRLNPIYWIIQFFGGLVAIGSLFFIPYLVNMILGGR